jgi:enoyl-[acyl-carrier protein] reductase I
MARTVTGITLYVDNGLHAMGMALDAKSLQEYEGKK